MKDRYCPSPFERRQQATDDRLAMQARSEEIARSLLQTPQDTVEIPNITELTGRRRKRVGVGGMVLATTALALAAACGGGKGEVEGAKDANIGTPVAGTTLVIKDSPIPVPATATPEVKKALKKLAEAEFRATTYKEMVQAIDTLYLAHPDIAGLYYEGGSRALTRESMDNNLTLARSGDPNETNAKMVAAEREVGFINLTSQFLWVYQTKGYEEAYEVAVTSANYFLTELPEKKAEFDKNLQKTIQDESPVLP